MAGTKPPQTLQLDEEAPQTLQLDEAAGGAEGAPEPTEKNLPGSTPRLRAAVAGGVAKMQPPTRFEQERTPEGSALERGAKAFGSDVLGAARGMAEMVPGVKSAEDLYHGDALKAIGHLTPGPDFGEMSEKVKALQEGDVARKEKGYTPLYRGAAALGQISGTVDPTGMEEAAEHGDTAGVVGHTVLPAIGAAVGADKALTGGKGMALAKETAKLPLRIADKVVRGTPITEAGRIEAAKQQALAVKKPSMSETDYAGRVQEALPELQRIAQDNKGKIKTPRQATQAINDRISQLEAPIADHIKNLPPEVSTLQPDQYRGTIEAAVDAELGKRKGSYKPSEMEKAKKSVMDFLGDQPKSIEELEGNRKRLNQDAESYYNSDTAGKRAIDVSDATAVAQRAAAHAARDVLYGDGNNPGALENAGVTAVDSGGQQVPIRQVRQTVGKLIDVRDHFEDSITRAEATGDWHMFDVAKKGPSLAAGGLGAVTGGAIGGLPGAILGTLLGEGGKAWTDYLNSKNPNLNVQKMFRNLGDTGKPNTVDVKTRAPIRQYSQPVGPQQAAHLAPIGPQLPPEPFELGAIQPQHQAGMWAQQVGAPPDLTWGGDTGPHMKPIGPAEGPAEAPLPPIQGQQQQLPLPPENAPLFNIQQTPKVGEPPTPTPPAAPEGTLPPIGGPGREGSIGRITDQEPLTVGGVTFGGGEDLGPGLGIEHTISVGGRRVGSITVEPREAGVLHVHWLGGDFGREMRAPIMDAIKEAYPETKKITYDRRRLAKGAGAANTEPREMNVKEMTPPK